MDETFATVSTGVGPAAISVIEIFGKDAVTILKSIFYPGKSNMESLKLYYGTISNNGKVVDEVVVRIVPADQSFSALETVEICCHGGEFVKSEIMKILESRGVCRIVSDSILDFALQNSRIDFLQYEAYKALKNACTTFSARILNDQANGALSKEVVLIKTRDDVKKLIKTSDLGISLTEPKTIVITGPPNSGKSSLFNALLKKERALVYDLPGTTRDPVRDIIAIKGVPFILVDTAGLEESEDKLTRLSIQCSHQEIQKAYLVIVVLDATKEMAQSAMWREAPWWRPRRHSAPKVLIVLNKIDLESPDVSFRCIKVSATRQTGIEDLCEQIIKMFDLKPRYKPSKAIVFTSRQKKLLLELLDNFDLKKDIIIKMLLYGR